MSLPLDDVPACRHAEGTISSSSVLDVWRMASEDSDQVVPGLAMIHRLPDLHDLRETRRREMTPVLHQSDALRELLEVGALRRAKRIPFEERNDRFDELR